MKRRIAFLRPNDGDTVDFEAGYIRHLEWHRQAKDAWTWYGWTIWSGERQRWFVFATFGHTGASLSNPVSPAEDQRDNFEAALSARQSALKDETLWFRMLSGGQVPRYVRLRPRPTLAAILDSSAEQALPDKVNSLIAKSTIEILNLRPTMSYGVTPVSP